jgi:hypothetical protein
LNRILFSQDEDLLVEAVARQRAARDFATVIYAHQLRVGISRCVDDLELFANASVKQEQRGRVIFLPLK